MSAALITQLYIGYYNRAPDPAGLNYWVGIANSGQSIKNIAEFFALQDESKAAYPYLANPNISDPNAFVNSILPESLQPRCDRCGSRLLGWRAQCRPRHRRRLHRHHPVLGQLGRHRS